MKELDPIADDEELFRRVSASAVPQQYDPVTDILSDQAFAPHKTMDASGISVYRKKFKSLEQAAVGRPGKSYFVAVLRAGDLRRHGISVVPRPNLPDGQFDAAHAELPDLNSATRKHDATIERQRLLANELCLRVEGPFPMPESDSA
ncbi:MAG: hypothetical protein R3C05_00110 [Pirellulaceae bacterium]